MKIKLLVVQGRPQGKALLFPRGEYVFGRGHECHVRPNSDCVSRQHCLLRVGEDGVHLRDLGSRNGTLVNGTRVKGECRLEHGDKVQVGPLVFQLELDEAGLSAELITSNSSPDIALPPTTTDTQEMSDELPETAEQRPLRQEYRRE
jgi:pSer/pThr/pTyr-binding forkhead associated (FHA) protein